MCWGQIAPFAAVKIQKRRWRGRTLPKTIWTVNSSYISMDLKTIGLRANAQRPVALR
jgi:hypothetical protein